MVREEKTEIMMPTMPSSIYGETTISGVCSAAGYMLTKGWNQSTNRTEGIGKMFHGNFWAHVEMDLETGELIEKENVLQTPRIPVQDDRSRLDVRSSQG